MALKESPISVASYTTAYHREMRSSGGRGNVDTRRVGHWHFHYNPERIFKLTRVQATTANYRAVLDARPLGSWVNPPLTHSSENERDTTRKGKYDERDACTLYHQEWEREAHFADQEPEERERTSNFSGKAGLYQMREKEVQKANGIEGEQRQRGQMRKRVWVQ